LSCSAAALIVEIAHDDARIWKKSVEIAARDIAEIFQQHRPWDDLAALQDAQFAPRANFGLGLHCHHKYDVVEHLDLNFAPPQAEPFGNLKPFDMVPALVKAHLTEISRFDTCSRDCFDDIGVSIATSRADTAVIA
jgi:hypothetical protein